VQCIMGPEADALPHELPSLMAVGGVGSRKLPTALSFGSVASLDDARWTVLDIRKHDYCKPEGLQVELSEYLR